jgi:hypothetical protein
MTVSTAKWLPVFCVTVVLLFGLAGDMIGQTAEPRLEGCPAPAAIAAGLRALRDMDWRDVSVARVQKMWPTPIRALECEDAKACSSMIHEGRIINNEIECAEVFNFDITRNEDGTADEHLRGITIHYTTATRTVSVAVAREFSTAIGLSASDTSTVGRENNQWFRWETDPHRKLPAALDLRWLRIRGNWYFFFAFGREPFTARAERSPNEK